jgi:hypothetical protein
MQRESQIAGVLQRMVEVQMQAQPRPRPLALALAMTMVEAQVEAEARGAEAPDAEALVHAQALVNALAEAEAEGEAEAEEAGAEAEARTRAEETWPYVRAQARLVMRPMVLEPTTKAFTYREVLGDSKLMKIIYSIEPHNRDGLARHLRRRSQEFWWLIQIIVPITRLPPELLHQIFLIIIDQASGPPLVLMQVCKYWYTIIASIWASLELGITTPKDAVTKKLERNQWFLDISVDTESDRDDLIPSRGPYEAIFAVIEAASRWRSFVVETFPPQADLPEHLVNHGLQRSSGTVMSRLRTFRVKSACETSPLLDHILRILGTTASEELTTVEIKSENVLSFLVPMHSSIFHSVKVLTLDTPGMPNPVDLLPHLHQLETLNASHLPLPIYHNDVNLPFVRTLRHLTLRSVSIQWMSGRTFPILETCTLLFPLHRHVLHTFHTTLPNCKHLTFEGYPLDILEGVSAHSISQLSVMSSCSNKLRGNRQLARFSSQTLRENRLPPRILHISIEATTQAWIKALAFMSNLEELVIDNAQPSSLGAKVLQSLVVHPVYADNVGTAVTSGGWNTPVCPSLKRFGLRYRRWLRPTEHFDLIPDFASIIWSRQQSTFSLQSFRIWTRSDQQDPVELLRGLGISRIGFERLANDCGIKIEDLVQLVASGLVENNGVGRAEMGEFLGVSGFTHTPPPLSPQSLYYPEPDNTSFDDDLDFHIHDHDPERDSYDSLENMSVLCDDAVDVGTLSGSSHHQHHHSDDYPVSTTLPLARSQPGAVGSSSRPSRPVFRSGWSFRLGKSKRGASSREAGTGGGSGVFSWFKKSRKESAPVR